MKAVKALKCVGLQATFRETLEVLAAKFKHTFFVPGAPVSTRSAGRAQSALWCLLWCLCFSRRPAAGVKQLCS